MQGLCPTLPLFPPLPTHHQYSLFFNNFQCNSKQEYMHYAGRPDPPPELKHLDKSLPPWAEQDCWADGAPSIWKATFRISFRKGNMNIISDNIHVT